MCNYNPHRKLSLSSAEEATSNSRISLLILLALSSIPELTSVAPFYHPWAHVHAHDLFFFFAQLEPNLMCGQQQMESLLQRIHCVVQSNDLCSRHMFCFRTLQMSSTLTCNTVFPTLCQLRIYIAVETRTHKYIKSKRDSTLPLSTATLISCTVIIT